MRHMKLMGQRICCREALEGLRERSEASWDLNKGAVWEESVVIKVGYRGLRYRDADTRRVGIKHWVMRARIRAVTGEGRDPVLIISKLVRRGGNSEKIRRL